MFDDIEGFLAISCHKRAESPGFKRHAQRFPKPGVIVGDEQGGVFQQHDNYSKKDKPIGLWSNLNAIVPLLHD
jgi:hypothetical protein